MSAGQEEPGPAAGQGRSAHQDCFTVTPGGSDKTSLTDPLINHQRLKTEWREREEEGK